MLCRLRKCFADAVHRQQKGDELVDQHSGEVAADSEGGNRKDNEVDADGDAGEVVHEHLRGFSEPVQNSEKRGIQVHQRTNPGERPDEGAGELVVEEQVPGKITQKKEPQKAADAEREAGEAELADGGGDGGEFSGRLRLRDNREQHRAEGGGQRGRKQNQRQRHAGEHAVNTQRNGRLQTGQAELQRDKQRLDALQDIDKHAVQRKRHGDQQKFARVMRGGVHRGRQRRLCGKMDGQRRRRKKRGEKFLQNHTVDGDGRSDGDALLREDTAEQHDAAKAHQMLQNFRYSGDFCLLQTIIIAVDAGVYGAEGNGVGKQTQQIGGARLLHKLFRQQGVKTQQQEGHAQGQGDGERHTGVKNPAGAAVVPGGGFGGDKPRDSGLDTGYGEGKRERIERKNKLVNSKPLCTDRAGEEYSIKKTDDPPGDAGGGQQGGALQNSVFLQHR